MTDISQQADGWLNSTQISQPHIIFITIAIIIITTITINIIIITTVNINTIIITIDIIITGIITAAAVNYIDTIRVFIVRKLEKLAISLTLKLLQSLVSPLVFMNGPACVHVHVLDAPEGSLTSK
ncbi:unnamed protein product [Clonostachys rhizophaga]|uniref:Uncharacterized protein n=1 Tax=Clonostachys rhizophaga TaxID=160324 RepID=A0A9N9YHU4_9HYPO|nr:unnamed protein product [Clonostachys rhizophaga]